MTVLDSDSSETRMLSRAEEKFRLLFEKSPLGMAMVDHATGEFLEVNCSVLQSTGYTREEFLQLSFWQITPQQYAEQEIAQIKELNRVGQFGPNEKEYIRKDGTRYPIKISGSMMTNTDGRKVVWGILEDITERKRAETELESYRNHLENLVEERSAALSVAKDAAEAASRCKTTFLRNMSHELRTPLNGIFGMIGLVQCKVTDPILSGYLDQAMVSAENLLSLVDDLLEFSEIESGQLVLDQAMFTLESVQSRMQSHLAKNAEKKGLTSSVTMSPELTSLSLRGDTRRLLMVLLHLANNAVKFTDKGSVALSVSVIENKPVDVLLRFEITDTGMGISAEDESRIFALFEQVDGSPSRKHGGTGLGLSLCQRLAAMMGGAIGVTSELHVGSSFWFTARFERAGDSSQDGIRPLPAAMVAGI